MDLCRSGRRCGLGLQSRTELGRELRRFHQPLCQGPVAALILPDEGPLRLVVPHEKRQACSVRQVKTLTVVDAKRDR